MKVKRGDIEGSLGDYLQNLALRTLLGGMKILPYPMRLRLVGWITSRIMAPLAKYDQRVRENLALVMPDLPEAEVKRLMRAVPASAGRFFAELYSGTDFKIRAEKARISGEGLDELEKILASGQGVILVSGHFGNYDVPRAVLTARGFKIGALYKPFRNAFFNEYYRKTVGAVSEPTFRTMDRKSLAQMVRFLKEGGMVGMLIDLHMQGSPVLNYFGKRASTAVSAAEMALKYDLALVPVYGLRQNDFGNYELIVEAPITHSTPEQMTQELNDSLERQVRGHMDQYFWIHRRWKAETRNLS